MRLPKVSPPVAILSLVALAFTLLAYFHTQGRQVRSLACKVTFVALLSQVSEAGTSRPVVVTERPDRILEERWVDEMIAFAQSHRGQLPEEPLMRRLALNGGLSPLIECPETLHWLDSRGILHSDLIADRVVRAAFKTGKIPDYYERTVLSTSVAAISADRSRALVAVSSASAPQGATGELLEFTLTPDGTVRLIARYPIWQS
jgi:hypothetical protein